MKVQIQTYSVKRLETPLDERGVRFYSAVAKVDNYLHELYEWRKINPRDPKVGSKVAKKIGQSAAQSPEMFVYKNRGFVILADSIDFDNKRGILTLTFTNPKKHGLLDGGHSCKVLIDEMEDLKVEDKENLFIKFEVMSGFTDSKDIVDIVDARNTSVQVSDKALMNLQGDFEDLKELLRGESYYDLIAYKDNELNTDDSKKPIDMRDIAAYLVCFDINHFNQERQPHIAYSRPADTLSHFKNNLKIMKKLYPLAKDILRLHDIIYKELPVIYNKNAGKLLSLEANKKSGGKFGGFKGVQFNAKKKKYPIYFIDEKSHYGIPKPFVLPVLAAFRAIIIEENGQYKWSSNPFETFDKHGRMLIMRICERALKLKNPNTLGKESEIWRGCYEGLKLAIAED